MELREAFITLLKAILSLIIKGSIFNIDFVGEFKEDISITNKV